MIESEKLYTTAEVAEMFSVKTNTVREWCKSGTIKAIQLPGGRWRIRESAVKELANERYGEHAQQH